MFKFRGVLFFFVFLLVLSPFVFSQSSFDNSSLNKSEIDKLFAGVDLPKNAWNETVIISPTWQKVMSSFFGLNLRDGSSEISFREAVVLFMILIIFVVFFFDVTKHIPFFQKGSGIFSFSFLSAIFISLVVSISGGFIYLKDFFLDVVSYIVVSLDSSFVSYSLNNRLGGIIIGVFLIIFVFVLHEVLDWLSPFISRYSKISRSEAKGNAFRDMIAVMKTKNDASNPDSTVEDL